MNPLVKEFLGAFFRWALTAVGAFLVAQGIITEEQSARFIMGAVTALISLSWVLWVKYGQRVKIVTSLAAPAHTTEEKVEQMIKAGDSPSARTPKDEVPR